MKRCRHRTVSGFLLTAKASSLYRGLWQWSKEECFKPFVPLEVEGRGGGGLKNCIGCYGIHVKCLVLVKTTNRLTALLCQLPFYLFAHS